MPIYEFYCPSNNKIYSFYARTIALADRVPRCPANPKFRIERMLSSFSVTGRAKESATGSSGEPDINDRQMEAALAGIEREIGGMDVDHSDPRALARMMRKMSGLAGEPMSEPMDEMIRRMEAGEDPEKLDAEYGDAIEDFDPPPGSEGDGGDRDPKGRVRSAKARPTRDPALYEMRDFLD
jgi:hypothetical protein